MSNKAFAILKKLIKYSDRYEISVQFWPKQTAVFIMKDRVDLKDWGGDPEIYKQN